MSFLIAMALITGLLLWYAMVGRAWLKTKPWAASFLSWIEPVEIALFKKSETILFARINTSLGVILTVLTQLGAIDITPLMPFVPPKYAGIVRAVYSCIPLALSFFGAIVEWLRNRTTMPVELVAVPDKLVAQIPAVANAVAAADAAKAQAVAIVNLKAS